MFFLNQITSNIHSNFGYKLWWLVINGFQKTDTKSLVYETWSLINLLILIICFAQRMILLFSSATWIGPWRWTLAVPCWNGNMLRSRTKRILMMQMKKWQQPAEAEKKLRVDSASTSIPSVTRWYGFRKLVSVEIVLIILKMKAFVPCFRFRSTPPLLDRR